MLPGRGRPGSGTPRAVSTWLGWSGLAEHAEPEATARPRRIELLGEQLTVEAGHHKGEDVGEPVRRVSDDVDAGHGRRRSADPVDEAPLGSRVDHPGRGDLTPGLGGGEDEGDPRRGERPALLRLPGRSGWGEPRAGADRQETQRGSGERGRVPHEHLEGRGRSHPAEGGGGIDNEGDSCRPGCGMDGLERLHGPHLAVRVLEGRGNDTVGSQARGIRLGVDPAETVDRDGPDGFGQEQDLELDRGGEEDLAHPAPGMAEAGHRDGQRLGAEEVEGQLVGSDPGPVGEDLAGLVEEPTRSPSLGVQAARIGPAGVDRGQQGLPGGRVERGPHGVEENTVHRDTLPGILRGSAWRCPEGWARGWTARLHGSRTLQCELRLSAVG